MVRQTITYIRSKSKYAVVMLISLITGGVLAGSAMAAIPQNGVINACYRTSNGNLRVIDTASQQCRSGTETALSWNAQAGSGVQKISNAFNAPLGSIPASSPQVLLTIPNFGTIEAICDENGSRTRFHNTSVSTVRQQYDEVAPGAYSDTVMGDLFIGSGAQTRTANIYVWAGAQGDPVNTCYFQGYATY